MSRAALHRLCSSPVQLPASCSGWNNLLKAQGEFLWPRSQVPRVQVPAIPQHGKGRKGANCLDRPQDSAPPLPSLLAQQEKILWPRVIRMEFLFNTSESHQPKLKHLALSEFLSLRFPYFNPGNPFLKCSVLLFGEVACLFLQR